MALTAVVVAVVILWPGQPRDHFQNLAAPVGGRHATTLADGTRLELNAGTGVQP